jgi:hypothetical protein
MLLDFITKNPDAVVGLVSLLAGWFGVARWRQGREDTAAQVDRWAAAAVAAVQGVIASGKLKGNHAAHAAKAVEFFRQLAAGAGVKLSVDDELRARAIMVEKLNQAANVARDVAAIGGARGLKVADELEQAAHHATAGYLGGTANEILHDLRRLETVKGKAYRGGLGVTVTTIDPHTGARTTKNIPPDAP